MTKKSDNHILISKLALLFALFAFVISIVALMNPHYEIETKNIHKLITPNKPTSFYSETIFENKRNFDRGTFEYSCTERVAVDDWLNCSNCVPGVLFYGKNGACEVSYNLTERVLKWQ